ncbi:type II toxin-antitoxin system Phd/YefM family antitoxin [Sediminivirga luteola]|uniref:type II toxin-antitoxin system Phd/YefM family antitoxin n=1 Tax=Sediminivirga luteola TaxID=1774748 RepID=UPI001F579B71|nr:type II toxin-antitoxin system Phd/YefM family antitoxin [Sediminivirga luteola]MCI2266973.1 type II toxin-antitoxin system Phd/YefM family antitoxin [Sediminivirga luteola]
MSRTVGVREFRQDLADYIDQSEPVTVTRHGHTVGLFIPVRPDRKAEVGAYAEAVKKANALLAELGVDEDEVVAEFDTARKAKQKT